MTRTELETAQLRASQADRRRLTDGYEALRICTVYDLDQLRGTAEVRARVEIAQNGIVALQSLDDLGPEGNAIASRALRELQQRRDALASELGRRGG